MKQLHAAAIRHAKFNANMVIVRDDLRGPFIVDPFYMQF